MQQGFIQFSKESWIIIIF